MALKTKWFLYRIMLEDNSVVFEKVPAENEQLAKARIWRIYPHAQFVTLRQVTETEALNFNFRTQTTGKPQPKKEDKHARRFARADGGRQHPKAQRAEPQSLPECFKILGVPANASVVEIRMAYHKLLKAYHPDKVARLGADLIMLANEKTQEINRAYEEARSIRNRQNLTSV